MQSKSLTDSYRNAYCAHAALENSELLCSVGQSQVIAVSDDDG